MLICTPTDRWLLGGGGLLFFFFSISSAVSSRRTCAALTVIFIFPACRSSVPSPLTASTAAPVRTPASSTVSPTAMGRLGAGTGSVVSSRRCRALSASFSRRRISLFRSFNS